MPLGFDDGLAIIAPCGRTPVAAAGARIENASPFFAAKAPGSVLRHETLLVPFWLVSGRDGLSLPSGPSGE